MPGAAHAPGVAGFISRAKGLGYAPLALDAPFLSPVLHRGARSPLVNTDTIRAFLASAAAGSPRSCVGLCTTTAWLLANLLAIADILPGRSLIVDAEKPNWIETPVHSPIAAGVWTEDIHRLLTAEWPAFLVVDEAIATI